MITMRNLIVMKKGENAVVEIKDASEIEALTRSSGFLRCVSAPVAQYARLFMFSPADAIAEQGVAPEFLYYMASGRAKLYVTMANGKTALIDFFSAPCFIGEMELIGVQQEPCSVRAIERCVCLALPVAACGKALLQDAVFLRHICLYLGNKNAKNIRSFTKNQAYALKNRLAAFALMTSANGHYDEKHAHAADYLGVSYRHLLYVLADFVDKGILQKEQGGYRIADEQALLALARMVDPEIEQTFKSISTIKR